jgi:hypothetical protein
VRGTYDRDKEAEDENARVLPPHLATRGAGTAAERVRLAGHGICLVHEELDALTAREDLLDVLDHDLADLAQLGLRAGERIVRRGRVVGVDERAEYGSEGPLKRIGRSR